MTEQSDSKEADQAAKDAAVRAAFGAWRQRPRGYVGETATTTLWETMWEAGDFSWEGLADAGWERGDGANEAQKLKRWRAHATFPGGGDIRGEGEAAWKEATLQDYWRWSLGFEGNGTSERLLTDLELEAAGLLLRGDGDTLWHRLHLRSGAAIDKDDPAVDMRSAELEDGVKISGAGGGNLTSMLLARLAAGFEAEADGPEGALRLIGARVNGLGEVLRTYSALDAEDHDNCLGLYVDARSAALCNFDVHGAQFHGTAHFSGAQFIGLIRFNDVQFFGEARFDHVQFRGQLMLSYAQFRGAAQFDGAQFRGPAMFVSTRFCAEAQFNGAQFRSVAFFLRAQFHGEARFGSAQFRDRASFTEAQFLAKAAFSSAKFRNMTVFDGAQFRVEAHFIRSQFRGEAQFIRTEFLGEARFNIAQFRGVARFTDAIFAEKSGAGPVVFRIALFLKLADFSGCRFPKQPERVQGAFETTRFLEEARFRSPDFDAFSAFDGAVFKGKLLLAAAGTEREGQRRFDAVLRATEAAVEEDRRIEDCDPEKDEHAKERGANNRFAALEGGLRVLKTAMEAEKDHMQEHRFFRFELQAKRRRPSVSWLECLASRSYGVLSDYGNSMGWPLAWLIFFVSLFTAVFWVWSYSLDPSTGWWQALTAVEISIRNVVQPFAPWAATKWSPLFNLDVVEAVRCGGPPPAPPSGVACPAGGVGWFVFRLVATLQSVLSLLLAFLFALALRKKFQIS